jgi:hypothetical protein
MIFCAVECAGYWSSTLADGGDIGSGARRAAAGAEVDTLATMIILALGENLPSMKLMGLRVLAVVVALALWFITQKILARRTTASFTPGLTLSDGVHDLILPITRMLQKRPVLADRVLIGSSAVIDLLAVFVLVVSVIGPTVQPFVAMLMCFACRQACQFCSPLPPPEGMIWRHPGVPSLLVTYGTTTDFFFSGHTSLAVLGALTLGMVFGPVGWAIGAAAAVFEMLTVLVLRAHYTMDVYAGVATAVLMFVLAGWVSPGLDRMLTW